MRNILFVNPPYEVIGVTESVSSVSVTLSLAMLAGIAKRHKKEATVIDLNLHTEWEFRLRQVLDSLEPDMVAITFTTPLVNVSRKIAAITREILSDQVVIVGGGAHATALPAATLADSCFDAVAVGEAEESFAKVLVSGSFANTTGWFFRLGNEISSSGPAELVNDLDALPFGAYELFDVDKYVYPKETSRANPVCLLETSRGCYARCTFCNKNIFGYKIRRKTPGRVVDEMEHILSLGFNEIHLADDLFTADRKHAMGVCKEIIDRGNRFHWLPRSGIRVDTVSAEMFDLMREAGCYHVPFGIESGNQAILDTIRKGITIQQIKDAVALAKASGLETTGYFMFGLPGETYDTVQETIDLAVDLDLDHMKFGVTIPLPGTVLFEQMKADGRLLTYDWSKYTYSTPPWEIYQHPSLSRSELERLHVMDEKLLTVANKSIHVASKR